MLDFLDSLFSWLIFCSSCSILGDRRGLVACLITGVETRSSCDVDGLRLDVAASTFGSRSVAESFIAGVVDRLGSFSLVGDDLDCDSRRLTGFSGSCCSSAGGRFELSSSFGAELGLELSSLAASSSFVVSSVLVSVLLVSSSNSVLSSSVLSVSSSAV